MVQKSNMPLHIQFFDAASHPLATAMVEDQGDHYTGTIDLRVMPLGSLRKFEEYEALVEGQVLSRLNEAEEEISAMSIRAAFSGDRDTPVTDLQIFPRAGTVSFKLAQAVSAPHVMR